MALSFGKRVGDLDPKGSNLADTDELEISLSGGTGSRRITGLQIKNYVAAFIQAFTGAISRTLSDKFGETVSVKDFGAVGDGVADDTAALNAAFASNAQRIIMPEGVYKTTASVFALSKKIVGAGREATIIQYSPASYVGGTNVGLWIGDHTNNVPTAYGTLYPQVSGLSVRCGQYASAAMRVREVYGGRFSDLYLGAISGQTPPGTTVNQFVALVDESTLNTKYVHVEGEPSNGHQDATILTIACLQVQSNNLALTAGSGNGSTVTTTTFDDPYFHHTAIGLLSSSTLHCAFNSPIFEAIGGDASVMGPTAWPLLFDKPYFEAIGGYCVNLGGTSASLRASAIVRDGFWNSGSKQGDATVANDVFAFGTYIGKLDITNLTIANATGLNSLIKSSNSAVISVPAFPLHPVPLPNAAVGAGNGGITTTSGSAVFEVVHIAHGRAVGDVVGLQAFQSPYNGLAVNQPFYRIVAIVNTDRYTVQSILFPSVTANASGTQTGTLSENVVVYPVHTWLNCLVSEADRVNLNDCLTQELVFSQEFSDVTAATNLLYQNAGGGGGGQRSFVVDDWTYIMSAQGFCDADFTGMVASVIVDMPAGYETGLTLGTLPTTYSHVTTAPDTQYNTAVLPIGIKVPPGTAIRFRTNALGASTLQGRVVIARTRQK